MLTTAATGGAVSRLLCTGGVNGTSFSNDMAAHGGALNLVRSRADTLSQNSFTGEQVRIHAQTSECCAASKQ